MSTSKPAKVLSLSAELTPNLDLLIMDEKLVAQYPWLAMLPQQSQIIIAMARGDLAKDVAKAIELSNYAIENTIAANLPFVEADKGLNGSVRLRARKMVVENLAHLLNIYYFG